MSERTTWNNNYTFLMAMIGSAVGLGNIWRFPYIYYTNSQGTFLIPYLVAIIVLGLSFLFVEYAVGNKFKDSILNIYEKINDKLLIVGWAIILALFILITYYIVIVSWDLLYFFLSFTQGWGLDPNTFFTTSILHSSTSFSFVPIIAISILVLWVLLWYICHRDLNKGIGKVSNILVPLTFIIMICIVLYSLTLSGAEIGIHEFFKVDWNGLKNPNIWLVAFGQIIFSLSIGFGSVLTYASYLEDNTNFTKNAVITLIANCGFEVVNAIGIFSILGFMVLSSGVPFNQLISEGTGLAFIAFPQIFNIMGTSGYILGPIFFFCILIAGITSLISIIEPITSSLSEKFNISRKKVTSALCVFGFLVSLIYATSYGSFLIGIIDSMLNNIILIFIIILECLIYGYIVSIDSLLEILNRNTLFKVGNWWKYLIRYVIPIILVILWISGILEFIFTATTLELIIRIAVVLLFVVGSVLLYYLTKKIRNK